MLKAFKYRGFFSCNSTSQSSKIITETKNKEVNVGLVRIKSELDVCKQANYPQTVSLGGYLIFFSFIANRLSRHLHKHPTVLRVEQEIFFFHKKTQIPNDYQPIL